MNAYHDSEFTNNRWNYNLRPYRCTLPQTNKATPSTSANVNTPDSPITAATPP
jgi:hypothetical protein